MGCPLICTLDLFTPQAGDAGTYTCTAENAAGRAARQLRLTVLVPPAFTELPGDLSLSAGEGLELVCGAKGNPMPRITWTMYNQPVMSAWGHRGIDGLGQGSQGMEEARG